MLIDINGTNDTMNNFQITLSGVDDNHVLYNFYQATTLVDGNVSIEGSLLAPYAAVSGGSDHINGTRVANSLTGGMEQHAFTFQGNPPSATPEPGTWVTFAAGFGLIGLARLRRADRW